MVCLRYSGKILLIKPVFSALKYSYNQLIPEGNIYLENRRIIPYANPVDWVMPIGSAVKNRPTRGSAMVDGTLGATIDSTPNNLRIQTDIAHLRY